ncbi:Double-stranded RNA-binding protein [Actinidia chinensis var. chinensis]|uniref:Double-stranded RNA-binding protein n=1 Tax=Actinidia chinensis var. chinensis TaxID=1590841 RepID=A0A2R6QY88_ACTCC|nr:Double-stranded RNA-binding protein [Actinidia chinensis var. chinensis]
MSTSDAFQGQGVSNCYVFKSRLQEYAQKVGLPTPVYETIKEGPSHEPSFRSTVIVNDVRYDSLSGFFNRKAAEQSAAEVALVELSKTGKLNNCISQPVHETGLCKNLLQEYAQKMNYAIPTYECRREELPGRMSHFSCMVDIGGIKYIGGAAKTKKEAEIKAARTALLAIRSSASHEGLTGKSAYTVVPSKKERDLGISAQDTAKVLKPKKGRFKKRQQKKMKARDTAKNNQVESNLDGHVEEQLEQASFNGNEGDKPAAEGGAFVPYHDGDAKDRQLTAPNVYQSDLGTHYGITSLFNGDGLTSLVSDVNTIPGIMPVTNSSMCQGEVLRVVDGLNQMA